VLVVEDHRLLAEIMAQALRDRGVPAAVSPGTDAGTVLAAASPGTLVLLDLDLAGTDGGLLVVPLREAGARVLVVSGSRDLLAIGRALDAGAVDVLDKARPFDDLVAAIAAAADGTARDPAARRRLEQSARHREAERAEALAVLGRLTPREREVLDALAAGTSADEIAAAAVVSLTTVRSQIRSILGKLGVHNQLAAAARARDLAEAAGNLPIGPNPHD
jgi:DNA-binding NarL/FixJ family response regulator